MKKLIENLSLSINKYFFPFYRSKEIKLLFESLEQGKESDKEVAMFVGGCVRNYLQSNKINDIDIATILTPLQIKNKLNSSKFRVIDTGIDHGTVTVEINNKKFELTTLRQDLKTDGRHAEIKTIDDWQEDSKRRDFTMNAIYLTKKGKIFDPQLGVNDLKNNIVKFIGDPQTRIKEDFLRIIRFIRFSIQYNSKIENSTIQAIKLNLNGIKKLSKERILIELFKILKLKNFSSIEQNKELLKIFLLIFPEFENIKRFQNFKSIKNFAKDPLVFILAVLLINDKNNHEYFSHKYNVSKNISKSLSDLYSIFKEGKNDKEFFKRKLRINLYNYGKENLKKIYLLNLLDKKKIQSKELLFINELDKISIPNFPYDGNYLINKGVKEGKKVGLILHEAEKIWLSKDFSISKDDFENIIKKNI